MWMRGSSKSARITWGIPPRLSQRGCVRARACGTVRVELPLTCWTVPFKPTHHGPPLLDQDTTAVTSPIPTQFDWLAIGGKWIFSAAEWKRGRTKGRECTGRGGLSRKDWCWGKPALRSTHTHSPQHSEYHAYSHHTPKLLNRQEKHWLWLILQPITAGQDREDVKNEWRPNRAIHSSVFYLRATVKLLSSQEVQTSREVFTNTSPFQKTEVGKAARAEARTSVASLPEVVVDVLPMSS